MPWWLLLPTGQKLLDSLAETWDFFFSDVLPTLQAIFYPVQVYGWVHGSEGSPTCPRYTLKTWNDSRKHSRLDALLYTDLSLTGQLSLACLGTPQGPKTWSGEANGGVGLQMVEKALLGEATRNLKSLWEGEWGKGQLSLGPFPHPTLDLG